MSTQAPLKYKRVTHKEVKSLNAERKTNGQKRLKTAEVWQMNRERREAAGIKIGPITSLFLLGAAAGAALFWFMIAAFVLLILIVLL